jgi:uncharacterized membrane protein
VSILLWYVEYENLKDNIVLNVTINVVLITAISVLMEKNFFKDELYIATMAEFYGLSLILLILFYVVLELKGINNFEDIISSFTKALLINLAIASLVLGASMYPNAIYAIGGQGLFVFVVTALVIANISIPLILLSIILFQIITERKSNNPNQKSGSELILRKDNKTNDDSTRISISKSKYGIRTFVAIIGLISAAFVVVPIVIRASYPFIKDWFDISNGYDAAYLTSTMMMAVVTVLYAIFTYFIFVATYKSAEQTSVSQKIEFLERKLELFYLPLRAALNRFDIDKVVELNNKIIDEPKQHRHYSIEQVDNIWWRFKDDYDKIIPYTYLALDEKCINIEGFTSIFEKNRLFAINFINIRNGENYAYDKITELIEEGRLDKYMTDAEKIAEVRKTILGVIDSDIGSLKEELNGLVSQQRQ